jgi:hypothetical protein
MKPTMRSALWSLAAAGALLGAAAEAQAQAPPQQPAPEPELVFEREIFRYPAFQRRNPFIPLEGAAGGIRFEQLSLIGIMYSPDPTASVAVLSTGGVQVAADGTVSAVPGDAYNLKVGQTIGNTTIREIQRDRVIVDVEEFGLTDRRTMFFLSRRQGGSQ